jgi:hypothetical protein
LAALSPSQAGWYNGAKLAEANETMNGCCASSGEGPACGEKLQRALRAALARARELIAEGNKRRLTLRSPDDRLRVEMPLTLGALLGSLLVLFAPLWALLGAAAAALARVRVHVTPAEGGEQERR